MTELQEEMNGMLKQNRMKELIDRYGLSEEI